MKLIGEYTSLLGLPGVFSVGELWGGGSGGRERERELTTTRCRDTDSHGG